MNGLVRDGADADADDYVAALPVEVDHQTYRESFGETLDQTLDLARWTQGTDLAALYLRIEQEVHEAIAREEEWRRVIREQVFPMLRQPRPGTPPEAGVYRARRDLLDRIYTGLLFNGGVEACDGTRQMIDTIPLSVYQVGVSLTSYQGSQNTWGHRLFRRDLRLGSANPTADVLDLLERRSRRGGLHQPHRRDALSDLAGRGIMAYAERAILLRCSDRPWRMGHGSPLPHELLTGSGYADLMIEGTRVARELIERHQRFVYVSSESADRELRTIGQALWPMEYAIVQSLRDVVERIVAQGYYPDWGRGGGVTVDTTWDGERLSPVQWIQRVRDQVAPRVVVGIYRASEFAPAQVFYAHAAHAHLAAHLVLADSVLQLHRGFPLLLDLADTVCARVFGRDTLAAPVETAYTGAGAPFREFSERATRR